MKYDRKLTELQKEFYQYIIAFICEHGRQPSIKEMCEYYGVVQRCIYDRIKALENHGLIKKVSKKGFQLIGVKFKAVKE